MELSGIKKNQKKERIERDAKAEKIKKWMDILGPDHAIDELYDFHAHGNEPALFYMIIDYNVEQRLKTEMEKVRKTDTMGRMYS